MSQSCSFFNFFLYFQHIFSILYREEIRNKYSKNADSKIVEEYERTKQDFYRMELDK